MQRLIHDGHDFIIVQSAGNDADDAIFNGAFTSVTDEGLKKRIIVVGASDRNNRMSPISNYGDRVDVVAPGVAIWSCYVTDNPLNPERGPYEAIGATSQATPHVSGVAAMMYAINPELNGVQVKHVIVQSAHYSVTEDMTGSRAESIPIEQLGRTYRLLNAIYATNGADNVYWFKPDYWVSYSSGSLNNPWDTAKFHDMPTKISSTIPWGIWDYFKGWYNSKDAEDCYLPGDMYYRNESTTLIAEWKSQVKIPTRRPEAPPSDPLIVDLDGDGVGSLPMSKGIQFDHNGSGFKFVSGWAHPNDGILCRPVEDANGDFTITNGTQLFGDKMPLNNGQLAANGFEALKELDSNNNDYFDENDDAWSEVYVWQDANSNARVNAKELISLDDAGIAYIDLGYKNTNIMDAQGNAHLQISTVTKNDETKADIADVWFASDVQDSTAVGVVDVDEDVAALPDLSGFGTTYSLHQTMMRDTSGTLKNLLEQFIAEESETARKNMMPSILYAWTGGNNAFEALEALYGMPRNQWPTRDTTVVNQMFNETVNLLYKYLSAKVQFAPLYSKFTPVDENADEITFDMTGAAREILDMLSEEETDERVIVEFINNMYSLLVLNRADIAGFRDVLAEENVLYGHIADIANKTIIQGTAGSDTLSGTSGNDAFWDEYGNNTFRGNGGDDTYFFGRNHGTSTIENAGGDNTVLFLDGITPEDLQVERIPIPNNIFKFDIEVSVAGKTEKLIIKNYAYKDIYSFVFANGETYEAVELFANGAYTEIHNADDLDAIRNNLSGNYRIMADIDLGGLNWTPIGTASEPYIGYFDGNGFAVQNLNINLPEQDYVGLFGYSGGVLKNVLLEDVGVNGKNYTGGLAGRNAGRMADCSVDGAEIYAGQYTGSLVGFNEGRVENNSAANITVTGNSSDTGGLVGYNKDGSITNCWTDGGSVSGVAAVGGLVGWSNGTIRKSYAKVDVTGTGNNIGGFVGYNGGSIANCWVDSGKVSGVATVGGLVGWSSGTVKKSYVKANVTGTGNNIGGFVGHFSGGTIEQCYATGHVAATSSYAGGFAGQLQSAMARNCFSTGNVPDNASGFVGRIQSATVENCYTISNSIQGINNNRYGGAITSSYFDTDLVSRVPTSAPGRTTAEMMTQDTYGIVMK